MEYTIACFKKDNKVTEVITKEVLNTISELLYYVNDIIEIKIIPKVNND